MELQSKYSVRRFIHKHPCSVLHADKSTAVEFKSVRFGRLTTVEFIRPIVTVTFKVALPREGDAAAITAPKFVLCARSETVNIISIVVVV
jgi:hypothetical protein